MAQRITGRDLWRLEHGDHVDTGSADTHRKEAAPVIGVQVPHLIVHHLAARLPKSLARSKFSGCLSPELEEDPALQDVTENRSRMSVWLESGVGGGKLDELCHRVCAFRNWRRCDAQQIGDLGVACDQHAVNVIWGIALVVGHLGAPRGGQLSRRCQGSSRITASNAADHALGVGDAYPITAVALAADFGVAIGVKPLDAKASPRELMRQRALLGHRQARASPADPRASRPRCLSGMTGPQR